MNGQIPDTYFRYKGRVWRISNNPDKAGLMTGTRGSLTVRD